MNSLSRDAKGFIAGITKYIQDEGKTSLLPKVGRLLGKVSEQSQEDAVAHVISAVALSDDEKARIERFVFRLMGHSVTVDATVDRDVVGGFVINIGDWVVDTSLNGQLQNMQKTLSS